MNAFVSASDAAASGSYMNQRQISDEVAMIVSEIRRAMDRGLTPDEMRAASQEKAAAEAAQEILSKIFH
ncbi:MAG: hypothetical protein HUK26_02800 [Duodenibacillus sp.]|nr:hypothetical protein [Duodenibacillus sp.]